MCGPNTMRREVQGRAPFAQAATAAPCTSGSLTTGSAPSASAGSIVKYGVGDQRLAREQRYDADAVAEDDSEEEAVDDVDLSASPLQRH